MATSPPRQFVDRALDRPRSAGPARAAHRGLSRSGLVPAVSLLALASIYLLYFRHAQYVGDDWLHLNFYLHARHGGFWDHTRVLRMLAENRMYGGFQLFWLSQWMNCFLVWALGYAPRAAFALELLLHTASALLFYVLLRRLRVEAGLSYLAAACLVLIPAAHAPIFWPVNCSFYEWPLLWLLLYLLATLATIEAGRWTLPASLAQAALALLALFAGSPEFLLLLAAPLWLALCFLERKKIRMAAAVTAGNGAVILGALALYRAYIQRLHTGSLHSQPRWIWSWDYFWFDLRGTGSDLARFNGFSRNAYYQLARFWPLALGAAAGALVLFAARSLLQKPGRQPGEGAEQPAWRLGLFAAGMAALAYAPIALLIGKTLRHYYTLSPYLALLLALPAGVGRRRFWGLVWGAAVCGYFAACTVAEIGQCWIPQARSLEAIIQPVAALNHVHPDDWIVVSAAPLQIGSAPPFALGLEPGPSNFGLYWTGVSGLGFAREIVVGSGRLRVFQGYSTFDTSPHDLAQRFYVIAPDATGRYTRCHYVAWEKEPGRYELLPLKDAAPLDRAAELRSREELRGLEPDIYFAKTLEHRNVAAVSQDRGQRVIP
ncbi:MAG TPA: hypothetical protein VEU62_00250 [Bryobacterales bacterium]|nr:hypothetical protein [Bryobacterales bacterium]